MRFYHISSLILCTLFFACTSSQQNGDGANVVPTDTAARRITAQEREMARREAIGLHECRIIGTVVAIDQKLDTINPGSLCGRFPCKATVRVDSVFGSGSSFSKPFVPGENVVIYFGYSLAPTSQALPSLGQSYPGLSVGSRFQADVAERNTTRGKEGKKHYVDAQFTVLEYKTL